MLPALLAMLEDTPVAGKAIHDAAVVASLVAHGLRDLITSNPGDFSRFSQLVDIRSLEDALRDLDPQGP